MPNNQIKSCQCFRFPSGSAMSAGERIKQKANIQINKNTKLLNCNNDILKTNNVRRVYRGNQNRLRSINGFKLETQKCVPDATCIFSEKDAPDFWILQNSTTN